MLVAIRFEICREGKSLVGLTEPAEQASYTGSRKALINISGRRDAEDVARGEKELANLRLRGVNSANLDGEVGARV